MSSVQPATPLIPSLSSRKKLTVTPQLPQAPERVSTSMDAPTRYVEVGQNTLAYRIIGSGRPLVLLNRFRGTLDDWDPLTNDLLAASRQVVVFDNVGIGHSGGTTPSSVRQMAADAAAFLEALFNDPVDVLGFSLGGYVAQRLALERPELVRKLVLAGTGPGVGTPDSQPSPSINQYTSRPDIDEESILNLFFTDSASSIASGREHWRRIHRRDVERAPAVTSQAVQAQVAAVGAWRQGVDSAYQELADLHLPVLVANGADDRMVPTLNSWLAFKRLPNAELILYPDSGHGFHYQYPQLFAQDVSRFLDKDWYDS